MKTFSSIYPVIFAALLLPFIYNCKNSNNVPTLVITGVTDITGTTASIGVNITGDGGKGVDFRGVCWGTSPNPTIEGPYTTDGSGTGSFTSSLSNLAMETKYYVRAYATNAEGVGYSAQVSFETMIADRDGNIYHKVTIGTQTWLVENLHVLSYRNGDPIPSVANGTVWGNGTVGACCSYNNDDNNVDTYGVIYNAYAVLDTRNIAPVGWHVATHADFLTLETFLGGAATAGGKMKETGTNHWTSPNTGADNSSGFTALPGGYRGGATGIFSGIGDHAYFWTTTAQAADAIYGRILDTNSAQLTTTSANQYVGMSVRCVKD
jgi:uncharacterized protein (TIGR02145 family)